MTNLIDTPAEGFPLPTMTPPTRTLRDVASRLTPGGRERARQRADVLATTRNPGAPWAVPGRAGVPGVDTARELREIREDRAASSLFPDPTVEGILSSVLDGEVDRRLAPFPRVAIPKPDPADAVLTSGMIGDYIRDVREQEERTLRAAFAGGRAYERGATLRRGVGKSFGSRRVEAQGVAGDYLRDDPQDGARLAALVLAGFLGQDPAGIR